MQKISKSLIIINIISLILAYVLQLNKSAMFYISYTFTFLKCITILVGISSIILTIIEFKNRDILVSVFSFVVCILTLPISFLRNSNYIYLFIPLIISIISIIILSRKSRDKINLWCIISIVIVTIIEVVCVIMPIYYGKQSISNFEKALPQIQQMSAYKGKKTSDTEGFNLMVDGKKIRIEHQSIGNETMFMDINGKELFKIKTFDNFKDSINFINYIIAIGKYGISAN